MYDKSIKRKAIDGDYLGYSRIFDKVPCKILRAKVKSHGKEEVLLFRGQKTR